MTASRLQAYTTARRHHYPTEKSEVNKAVCDSGWEVTLAQALDRHPDVERWIRNERLGWSIPWKHDGITRRYEPDFVAGFCSILLGVLCPYLFQIAGIAPPGGIDQSPPPMFPTGT